MADITLSSAVRKNLNSLQSTADLLSDVQNKLATGKKVNSALDNPSNFFTASGLTSRANDLGTLLDDMGQSVQTLKAADEGIASITTLAEIGEGDCKPGSADAKASTSASSLPRSTTNCSRRSKTLPRILPTRARTCLQVPVTTSPRSSTKTPRPN